MQRVEEMVLDAVTGSIALVVGRHNLPYRCRVPLPAALGRQYGTFVEVIGDRHVGCTALALGEDVYDYLIRCAAFDWLGLARSVAHRGNRDCDRGQPRKGQPSIVVGRRVI